MPSLVHHAGVATLVNLCFIVAALACAFGLPRRLAADGGARDETSGGEAHGPREPRETPLGRQGAAGITRPRSG